MLRFRFICMPILVWLSTLAAGCSSLHSEVKAGFDLSAVSSVAVEDPLPDRWNLGSVVRQELQGMGFVLLPSVAGQPDLLVRFFVTEAVDLDAESRLLTKPKGVHVQLVASGDSTTVAVADYFLGSTETPAQGIRKAFAGLREKIPVAGEAPKVVPHSKTSTEPEPSVRVAPQKTDFAKPGTDKKAEPEPEIKSRQHSPWTPVLKSWGFEDWGRQREPVQ